MSETKSRPYTITGVSFGEGSQAVFSFNSDNQIVGVNERLSNGNVKPVEPGTTDFEQAITSEEALNAYNINKFKGNKESYVNLEKLERAPDEEMSNLYTRNNKSFNNRSFISAGGVATIAQYSSSNTGNKQGGTYTNTEKGVFGKKETAMIHAYPLDIDLQQDHLKITRYLYRRPDINQSKGVRSKEAGNAERRVFIPIENVAGDSVRGSDPAGTIILPMPKATDVNAASWGKGEINSTGLAALGVTDKVLSPVGGPFLGGALTGKKSADAIADLKKKFQDGRGDFTSGGAGAIGQALTVQAVTGMMSMIPGVSVDTDTYLARTDGRVLNPNAEMLFQGPSIRDFAFSFLMIARSQKEGEEIRRIIRLLKVGMAPKFRNTTFLKAPDIFTLEYKNGPGKKDVIPTANLFNPGGLALTTMNVDYAPNGYWSAYRDSQPVAVKMDLNFTELRPIYQSDQLDTPENSVGY